MERGLIITDSDPAQPDLDRQFRLAQVARLYHVAGGVLDIVFLGRRAFGSTDSGLLHRTFDRFQQIGMLPNSARRDFLDQDNPRLFELIAEMRPGARPYDIIHLDQVLIRPNDRLGSVWVLDTYDAAWEDPLEGQKFDGLLAAFDGLKRHNADFALQAFRLPLSIPVRPENTGSMIGWVGDFGNGLADRWSELLAILAERGVRMKTGVLLAGPDAHWVDVPAVMAPDVLKTANLAPGAERALGLAVLPGDNTKAWLGRLRCQIAAGCPVLTTSGISRMCGAGWHLPTFDDLFGFADAIGAWCDGSNRQALLAATHSSDQAIRHDCAAMDDLLGAALSGLGQRRLAPPGSAPLTTA